MSADAVMAVAELPLPLLLLLVGSLTCSWSMAAEALAENVWFDAELHVTSQLAPLTVVAVDAARDVSCTVCGLAEDVVQSPGSVSVNAVSTFAGP